MISLQQWFFRARITAIVGCRRGRRSRSVSALYSDAAPLASTTSTATALRSASTACRFGFGITAATAGTHAKHRHFFSIWIVCSNFPWHSRLCKIICTKPYKSSEIFLGMWYRKNMISRSVGISAEYHEPDAASCRGGLPGQHLRSNRQRNGGCR